VLLTDILVVHRLTVQDKAALVAKDAHHHDKVLLRGLIVAETAFDAFAVNGHPFA
jgi:hypothetical protein